MFIRQLILFQENFQFFHKPYSFTHPWSGPDHRGMELGPNRTRRSSSWPSWGTSENVRFLLRSGEGLKIVSRWHIGFNSSFIIPSSRRPNRFIYFPTRFRIDSLLFDFCCFSIVDISLNRRIEPGKFFDSGPTRRYAAAYIPPIYTHFTI